jgi:SAM-dependent methyltransferase
VDTAAAWEAYAAQWLTWTDPAHEEGFWTVTWPTLREMLPPAKGITLDLGCGEGRGARELSSLGHRVLGIERAPTLASAAAERGTPVVVGDAARLPVRDGGVALIFASMSLLDIDDLDGAVDEIVRVLAADGSVVAAIVHPMISAFDTSVRREGRLELPAPYLTHRHYQDRILDDGREMTFTSVHRPVRDYLRPLLARGFVITDVREEGNGPIPWFLAFRADRVRRQG